MPCRSRNRNSDWLLHKSDSAHCEPKEPHVFSQARRTNLIFIRQNCVISTAALEIAPFLGISAREYILLQGTPIA